MGLTAIASWVDLRNREIPDWIPLCLAVWATVATAEGWSAIGWSSLGVGLGIGLVAGMAMFASGGFGGGDAKLLTALGATLGWKGIVVTLAIMGLAGGVMALLAMLRGRRTLAYGPVIAVGVAGYALLYGWAIWLSNNKLVVR
jgi:Flp pilus assembly protein protease CpaA